VDSAKLRDCAEAPQAAALSDEIDRDGIFVHRTLFMVADRGHRGSYAEMVIRFGDINITQVPRPNRDVSPIGCRYVQLGEGVA